jgi:hypothetical protein
VHNVGIVGMSSKRRGVHLYYEGVGVAVAKCTIGKVHASVK